MGPFLAPAFCEQANEVMADDSDQNVDHNQDNENIVDGEQDGSDGVVVTQDECVVELAHEDL